MMRPIVWDMLGGIIAVGALMALMNHHGFCGLLALAVALGCAVIGLRHERRGR